MNDIPVIDLSRWLDAIPVIIQQLADEPLFIYAGAALMFAFAWLLVYRLTSID